MDTDTPPTEQSDATAVLVKRLARPHPSGGTVIERPVILAEGKRSKEILTWISEHGGAPDSTLATTRNKGLHSRRTVVGLEHQAAPARRYILPAHAFD
jgi:hypothetical protein